jgi:hypothetical protein
MRLFHRRLIAQNAYRQKFLNLSQLGVAHRVLDILVPKPHLQRPRVVAALASA